MAVKVTATIVSQNAAFLSRLCGGEVGEQFLLVSPSFLSRLCGGEAENLLFVLQQLFLSRLCGGEVMR